MGVQVCAGGEREEARDVGVLLLLCLFGFWDVGGGSTVEMGEV